LNPKKSGLIVAVMFMKFLQKLSGKNLMAKFILVALWHFGSLVDSTTSGLGGIDSK
jgi:hypothetical protein